MEAIEPMADSTIMTLSCGIQVFNSKVSFTVTRGNRCDYWKRCGYAININGPFWFLGQAIWASACKENPGLFSICKNVTWENTEQGGGDGQVGKITCTHVQKGLYRCNNTKKCLVTIDISNLDVVCYNSEMDYYGTSVYKRIILYSRWLTSMVLNLFLS